MSEDNNKKREELAEKIKALEFKLQYPESFNLTILDLPKLRQELDRSIKEYLNLGPIKFDCGTLIFKPQDTFVSNLGFSIRQSPNTGKWFCPQDMDTGIITSVLVDENNKPIRIERLIRNSDYPYGKIESYKVDFKEYEIKPVVEEKRKEFPRFTMADLVNQPAPKTAKPIPKKNGIFGMFKRGEEQ